MSYFTLVPPTAYTFDNGMTYTIVKDIIRRIAPTKELKENYTVYDEYDIKDAETPEIVSFKFYGSTDYHWVVLLMNDIIDPRYEWVLDNSTLLSYVKSKYGSDDANVFGVHHYEDLNNGLVVDSDYPGAVSVTNYQYEETENETKRRIKVLKAEYLDAFVSQYENKING